MTSKQISNILTILFFLLICYSAGYWASSLWAPVSPHKTITEEPVIDLVVPAALNFIFPDMKKSIINLSEIRVKGILKTKNNKNSIVAISVREKPIKYLGLGDQISPGVTIVRVYSKHIIVVKNGVEVKIEATQFSNEMTLK